MQAPSPCTSRSCSSSIPGRCGCSPTSPVSASCASRTTASWFNRSAMSDTSPAKSSPTAEPMPLGQLRERLEGDLRQDLGSPGLSLIAMKPIPEGHSGFTYFIDAVDGGDDIRYVLRLPPPGARMAGPADVIPPGRVLA